MADQDEVVQVGLDIVETSMAQAGSFEEDSSLEEYSERTLAAAETLLMLGDSTLKFPLQRT